jgi:cyclophilin family peptidyl-prolyl cis-trans isomerase
LASRPPDRPAALRRRRNFRVVTILSLGIVLAALGIALGSGTEERTPRPTPSAPPRPEAACDAPAPPEADPRQYSSPPPQVVEKSIDYFADVDTSCGTFTIDLLEKQAPKTVNNFVFLAKEGFFDGLIFHRVEQNALVETGDPEPDPVPTEPASEPVEDDTSDGPGYTIPDELPKSNEAYVYGTVAMANDGPDTGGSMFFIVVHDPPSPDDPDNVFEKAGVRPDYTIFGRVLVDDAKPEPRGEPEPTLETIATRRLLVGDDPRIATRPSVPIYVNSIEIIER